jgi:hypothetical protein
MHPIVDTYNLWPGWYGGAQRNEGTAFGDNFEMAAFKKLKASQNAVLAKLPNVMQHSYTVTHERLVKSTYSIQNQQNRLMASDLRAGLLKLEQPARISVQKALFVAALGTMAREQLRLDSYESYLEGKLKNSIPLRAKELEPIVKKARMKYEADRKEIMKLYNMHGSTPFELAKYEDTARVWAIAEVLLGDALSKMHWTTHFGATATHSFANGLNGFSCLALYFYDFDFTEPMPPNRNCQNFLTNDESMLKNVKHYFTDSKT